MVPEPNPDCQPEPFSVEIFTEIYQQTQKKSLQQMEISSWKVEISSWKVEISTCK
jgi:hypothetical protein